MIPNTKKMVLGLLIIGVMVLLAGWVAAGEEVSISGTINDDFQLVADSGITYDIGDNEKGNEVMELVGKKVSVKGTVVEGDGTKIITINSFNVIK